MEGVFSGTISFIMAHVLNGVPFSQAVRDAFDKGYTEPDPRQDLGGLDVVRKLVILCRVAGEEATLDHVQLEPLVDSDPGASLDAFWEALPAHDRAFAHRVETARRKNLRLGYVASAENGELRVGFRELDPDHACANLRPGDNVFVLQTDRYHGNPLVVRGPGAGREVTAAGVFADLLRAVAEGSA
jgi:aspartokinase/homoserine dehydrogenase 1